EDEQRPEFSELSFVRNQWGQNPWVVLRVSILSALAELKPKLQEAEKNVTLSSFTEKGTDADSKRERDRLRRLVRALESFPLAEAKIPVQPMYGNILYKKADDSWEFWKNAENTHVYKIWDRIEQSVHDTNVDAFRTPSPLGFDHYAFFEYL